MGMVVKRFDVYLVSLDPTTVGSEIQQTRPCVVVSPDKLNRHIATVIVAPMASVGRSYPTRIACRFQDKDGQVVLDRPREPLTKTRLVKRLRRLTDEEQKAVVAGLAELFAE